MNEEKDGIKVVSRNRRASHDYHLERAFQAGLVLTGPEIKSVRAHNINIQDGFVQEQEGELWLMNVHIKVYEQSGIYGLSDPLRPRKLLLHRKEIAQILGRMRERGYTAIPTLVFLQRGRAKVEIALAKGKKLYDKRADEAKRESDRQIRQALKGRDQE